MSMGLNLKDEHTVALVTEVAARLGVSKTAAVRELARQRLEQLDADESAAVAERLRELTDFMQTDVWPHVPSGQSLTKDDIERITGMDDMERG